MTNDLVVDTRMLETAVSDLMVDADVLEVADEHELEQALICWALIEDAYERLRKHVREPLAAVLAHVMHEKRLTVEGVGTFERRKVTNRTAWDKEALLPDVLDTRLVDPDTGEITDPTPLDKVLHVWSLGTPRLTALRARGLDPDEYCTAEDRGYTLQLTTNDPKGI